MEIKITGTTGEGKTSIAKLLERELKKHGVKVVLVNEGQDDSENSFMEANLDKCLASMGEKETHIEVETIAIASSRAKPGIQVMFVNIDDWNRPIFKDTTKKAYYGSLDKLFPYGESEEEVLKQVTQEDLTYFGSSFNCEPWGGECEVEIVRS